MEREKKKTIARKPKRVPAPTRSSLAEDLQVEETTEPGVRVIFGASVHQMSLEGLTVGRARELARTILHADARSPVLVNGRPARASRVLAVGDTLEIVHHAGEKGALSLSAARRGAKSRAAFRSELVERRASPRFVRGRVGNNARAPRL